MSFIPYILIGLSVIVIAVVLYKKIPQLRVIDVETLPKEREKKLKEKIILQKFQRKSAQRLGTVTKTSGKAVKTVSKYGRRAVQRLYALEQYYQKVRRTAEEGNHAYDADMIKKLIDDAEALEKEEEFIPAEKIYIDIVSHNPKNVDAYEGLGHMYLKNDQLDQAKETFEFALKISPNDASVFVSLAELAMENNDYKTALEHLRKAVEKRAKNPKYLDFYIEAALKAGSLKDARKGIAALTEVNPENKKIQGFEKKFEKMKKEYIEKTSSK